MIQDAKALRSEMQAGMCLVVEETFAFVVEGLIATGFNRANEMVPLDLAKGFAASECEEMGEEGIRLNVRPLHRDDKGGLARSAKVYSLKLASKGEGNANSS